MKCSHILKQNPYLLQIIHGGFNYELIGTSLRERERERELREQGEMGVGGCWSAEGRPGGEWEREEVCLGRAPGSMHRLFSRDKIQSEKPWRLEADQLEEAQGRGDVILGQGGPDVAWRGTQATQLPATGGGAITPPR